MPARRTRPARVTGWHGNDPPATPSLLVLNLAPELIPSLVQNRAVESSLGLDVSTRVFAGSRRGLGHVPDPQVLDDDHRVVLADDGRGLVQGVAADVGDALVELRDLGSGFPPVVAELLFTGERPLVTGKALLVLLEAVYRLEHRAVRQGGKPGYPEVDADGGRGRVTRRFNFHLDLDAYIPTSAGAGHSDLFRCAFDVSALAVTHPAEFRQIDTAVRFVELEPLGIAEAVGDVFLLDHRQSLARLISIEGVPEGTIQIHQALLESLGMGVLQEAVFVGLFPEPKQPGKVTVPDQRFTTRQPTEIQAQRLVPDEPPAAGLAGQLVIETGAGSKLEAESLAHEHDSSIPGCIEM